MTQGAATQMRLQDARAELRITQARIATRARLSRNTVIEAEKGNEILALSAHAILKALNEERAERGLPNLKIDDIDFNIKR